MNEDLRRIAGIPITETEVLEVRSRRCNEDGDMIITIFARYRRQKTRNVTTFTLLPRDMRKGGYAFDLSSQLGCPVQCSFCGVHPLERDLTMQEVMEQVALLVREANKRGVEIKTPRKLSFSDGGELLLNHNCGQIICQLTTYLAADIKISSVLPQRKVVRSNLEQLSLLKQGFSRTLHLQISMSSTNELIRQQASRISLLTMAEIAEVGQKWYEAMGRKPTLTFTLTNSSHCLANEVVKVLPSSIFRARLHPYRPNGVQEVEAVAEKELQRLIRQFEEAGYSLVVGQFDPAVESSDSLLFSGTLSFVKDPADEDSGSEDSDDPEDLNG